MAALVAAVVAMPATAATWSFASDAPLLLGGTVAGNFSALDGNADLTIDASEVSGFTVVYTGAPPATSSFAIAKSMLDGADTFSFDLASGSFAFGVADAFGRSVSGGSAALTAVVGSGSEVDAGGMLTLAAVPEPTTWALMAVGLAALFGMSARRRGALGR